MGVPGKTRGHSIDIVLGGSRKNTGTMAGFTKELVKEAKDPTSDMNEPFKKAVLDSTIANRAGTPSRMMNMNMVNQTDMGQMPFQNNAIANAQGMQGINTVVNPNIPGTLPGSGNVPGNQQVPNPVARLKKSEGESEDLKKLNNPKTEKDYDNLIKMNRTLDTALQGKGKIEIKLPQEQGVEPLDDDEEFVE